MKDSLRYNLRVIFVLTFASLICGFVLSFVFNSAKAKIKENEKKDIYRAIYQIVDNCKNVKEKRINEETVYYLFKEKDELIGYAYLSQGQGYQGKIKILFAVDKSIERLLGIEIIESVETPGLGSRINEEDFKNQFKNLKTNVPVECVKFSPQKENQVQAITSATISSRAVVSILNKGIQTLKSLVKEDGK
ncbi:MAG: RnfABCDGE type electron transport complex subunit G [Candidatus Omnitrophica bacterium]|nr:RnfABCDGE type electron transport complex subunit G [Candidatus Omnitrophota bacterium]